MVHAEATADEDFVSDGSRYRGRVQIHGELWSAVSEMPLQAGDALSVVRRDGLTLHVQPAAQPATVLPISKEQEKNIA